MSQKRTARYAATGASIGMVAVIVGAVWAFGATAGAASPEPAATMSVAPVDFREFQADVQEVIDAQVEAARVEAERVAAEAQAAAAAEAARGAAEQAAADAAAEAARQAANQNSGGSQTAPAPSAPVRCPAGSTANSSDGVNDTSCFPDVCFTISVPDPAHPECDTAFRP